MTFSWMVQESKFTYCSLIESLINKVLFQISVYASVRGEKPRHRRCEHKLHSHFFLVISNILQKVLIKTEGCFQFLIYLLHSVPSQGWAGATFQKAQTSFLMGNNPYFVWPSEYSWPCWNTWVNICPGKARAV